MSYVLAAPEMFTASATDLERLGSALSAANLAAALPTTSVLRAGADEVSSAVASLFSGHAQAYQVLSTQVSTFHKQFTQALSSAGGAYASAEAAAASPMQDLLNAVNAPAQTLFGRPLIGDGAAGTASNPNGGAGGLLYGNGGHGWDSTTAKVAGGRGGDAGLIGAGGAGGTGGASAAG
ncbi:PE family protein, partial [Mycobacterium szulgai]